MPERWLVKNATTGELDFDPRAGAQQTFGGGLRGCFGELFYQLDRKYADVRSRTKIGVPDLENGLHDDHLGV